jgi:hypothetical protein
MTKTKTRDLLKEWKRQLPQLNTCPASTLYPEAVCLTRVLTFSPNRDIDVI